MSRTLNIFGVTLEREDGLNMQLRAAREVSDKTQAQVAKEVEISKTHYQNIEYGKSDPSVRTAIRIAKALNSTVEALFGATGQDETPDSHRAQ